LDKTLLGKNDPTPAPTDTPTAPPTPAPTEDPAVLEAEFGQCQPAVALVQMRVHKVGISCDDFWSNRCGFSDVSNHYSSPSKAFDACCESGGHPAALCTGLAGEVFVNDTFSLITEAECTELDNLAATHDLLRWTIPSVSEVNVCKTRDVREFLRIGGVYIDRHNSFDRVAYADDS